MNLMKLVVAVPVGAALFTVAVPVRLAAKALQAVSEGIADLLDLLAKWLAQDQQ